MPELPSAAAHAAEDISVGSDLVVAQWLVFLCQLICQCSFYFKGNACSISKQHKMKQCWGVFIILAHEKAWQHHHSH